MYERAFQHVFQLPDISGPRVALKKLHGFGRHTIDAAVHGGLTLADQVPDEIGNVVPAFAQRRQTHGKHVQPIVQVVAKSAVRDSFLEIAVRRGDDADVDLSRARSAEALELTLLQDAQKLGLQIERQVANLVEEQRPAMGQLRTCPGAAQRPR